MAYAGDGWCEGMGRLRVSGARMGMKMGMVRRNVSAGETATGGSVVEASVSVVVVVRLGCVRACVRFVRSRSA